MLKKVTLGTLIISNLVLGNVNDYRGVFSKETKEEIQAALQTFETKTDQNLYLNTLEENEGFEADQQEKAVIVNLIKNKENQNSVLKIQLKVSQDLNPEDISSDLSLLLTNIEEYTEKNDEGLVAINLIEGLQEILINTSEIKENEEYSEGMSLGTKVFLGILLTFLVLSIRIIQVKQKKKKYKLSKDRYQN